MLNQRLNGVDFALERLGEISGQVTSAVSAEPISSVEVELYAADGRFVTNEYAQSQGLYSLVGLFPGTYYVVANAYYRDYRSEVYEEMTCGDVCNPLDGTAVVAAIDSIAAGVDFTLSPLPRITGVVTSAATGEPVVSKTVAAIDIGGDSVASSYTNSQGEYEIVVQPGDYRVRTESSYSSLDYLDELYDDVACWYGNCDLAQGAVVKVDLEEVLGGVDFALEQAGRIQGAVTAVEDGAPLSYFAVRVADQLGSTVQEGKSNSVGEYEIRGLPPGEYYAFTDEGPGSGYQNELYDGVACAPECDLGQGTVLKVDFSDLIAGVDFSLDRLGTISGRVVDAFSGAGVSNGWVNLYDLGGSHVIGAYLELGGYYHLDAEPGTYYVVAEPYDYSHQLHDGIQCEGRCDFVLATPVILTLGSSQTVDFQVEPLRGLQGSVFGPDGAPLGGVNVDIWTDSYHDLRIVTRPNGRFSAPNLYQRTYYVSTDNQSGFVDQVYDGLQCPEGPAQGGFCDPRAGTPIVLDSSHSLVTDVDFHLRDGYLFLDGFESGDVSRWSD